MLSDVVAVVEGRQLGVGGDGFRLEKGASFVVVGGLEGTWRDAFR